MHMDKIQLQVKVTWFICSCSKSIERVSGDQRSSDDVPTTATTHNISQQHNNRGEKGLGTLCLKASEHLPHLNERGRLMCVSR